MLLINKNDYLETIQKIKEEIQSSQYRAIKTNIGTISELLKGWSKE